MKRATILTDGSSDTVLLPILRWLLGDLTPEPIELAWAELRLLPAPPRTLATRIKRAVELYPCDLLFVHRDAEREDIDVRIEEISVAVADVVAYVPIVPVRMQEAWLLHDEIALRQAAGKPNGTSILRLPPISRIEGLPDPKHTLHEALRAASEVRGRRATSFRPGQAAHRLADLISDWSPLRHLSAFRRLEQDTSRALRALNFAQFDASPSAINFAGDLED